ncbi:lysophospholipid acyltransferase family protein [Rhodobacteraceae bacterium NNCM2]|nr:lysophospholipid acyltransferase family protein [Coraliihabitans acroporae]
MRRENPLVTKLKASGAAPREISYSFSARSRAGKAVIRSIENLTGRPRLLRMALGYENEVQAGRDFWEVMQERYRIDLRLEGEGLANIPPEGPMVMVANHPYGILDGLAMGRILSAARRDFKIIAHVVFKKARDLDNIILPIDFGETKEAMAQNIETRKQALKYLAEGGAIGIFPGGTVSTSAKPFSRAMDPHWKTFTARMIAKSKATVVPVYFDGSNSRLFQIASHLNQTLRVALLINEFDRMIKEPLSVTIGKPLPREEIDQRAGDPKALMDYLRRQTYQLNPELDKDYSYGLYLG